MAAALPDLAKAEAAIVELTNAFRQQNKLAPVKPDKQLTATARAYATFLASRDLFSHTADGRQPSDRATAAGYKFCEIAENLALNQDSRGLEARDIADKAMTGWINSPGHRANLVSPGVTDIGVAVARSADTVPKFISVQVFGRPRSLEIEFQVSNSSGNAVSYSFAGQMHELTPKLSITHQSCRAGPLVFTAGGGLFSSARQLGQFEAADGQLYVVKGDGRDGVTIEVKARERLPSAPTAASPAPAAKREPEKRRAANRG